ncbi:MAG: spore maturation protein A [Clostridia bacterium]|nr:spore maturation protein A [Clostridia bacterium]
MMSWVWFGLIALSVVFGICTGRINQVSQAAISGAWDAVSLFLVLLAAICLWNGLMRIADKTGITGLLQRLLLPVTKRLFPDLAPGGAAMKAISMNIAANLLGLGNAATPLGLQAMSEMKKKAGATNTATNSMATFVVINTASLQLIPTTIAAIRIKYGAAAPFDILPAMWFASAVTLCFGIAAAKSMEGRPKRRLCRSAKNLPP